MPHTAMTWRFFAPLLSAQFMIEATHIPVEIFSFEPLAADPRFILWDEDR